MQNSSNIKDQGWRQKLDDFEDVPGNNLDKEASWNKLQLRKPLRKKTGTAWYWVAAACLVGAGIFLVSNLEYNRVKVTPPGIVHVTGPVRTVETARVIIQNDTAIINNVKQRSGQTNNISPSFKVLPQENNIAEEELLVKEQMTIVEEESPAIDSISTPVIPIIAAAKKLKVVHINEINPSQYSNSIVQQEGKPYFPINYKTKQVYTNNDGIAAKGKDNLIKIRLN